MTEQEISCEVLVIGGGPAGSTVATLLAQRGRDVVMMEKSRHPRFHIGESLLPWNMPLFEQLGVAEEIKKIGIVKPGAEFVSPWHDMPTTISFNDAVNNLYPTAYQVRRSEFDEILFKNATKNGVRAFEEHKVTGGEFDGGEAAGATVTVMDGDTQIKRVHARFVVDASGRDTFLANRFAIKHRNKKHNSAAMFGHFTGAKRLPGEAEGNISLFWFDHGWFWFIPLLDGSTSVGATCWPYYMKSRQTEFEQFFMDTIAQCPPLAERLKDAKLESSVSATGNFSYLSERCSGNNYIMLGDAYAFIDPVFSSGVMLAMKGAFAGAEAVDACLSNPQQSASALKKFDRVMAQGPKVFSWFIYRLTTPAMRALLMYKGASRTKRALISVLVGDVYGETAYGLWTLNFKLMYYVLSIVQLKGTVKAWWRRKSSIRVM